MYTYKPLIDCSSNASWASTLTWLDLTIIDLTCDLTWNLDRRLETRLGLERSAARDSTRLESMRLADKSAICQVIVGYRFQMQLIYLTPTIKIRTLAHCKIMHFVMASIAHLQVYLILYTRMSVRLSVCPSDEDQRLNHRAYWAQTAYMCQVGPGDGFRLGLIPIGH